MIDPLLVEIPTFMAEAGPRPGLSTNRTGGPYEATRSRVPSVDPPSTTSTSRIGALCARAEARQGSMEAIWLKVGIRIDPLCRSSMRGLLCQKTPPPHYPPPSEPPTA